MYKKLGLILALIVLMAVTGACGLTDRDKTEGESLSTNGSTTNDDFGGTSTENDNIEVGFIVSTLLNPFFVSLKDGVVAEAHDYGVNLRVLDSRDKVENEKANMKKLIDAGVDAILLNPTDPDASISLIEKAMNEGIPVFTIDRKVNSDSVFMHIASDNRSGGYLAGQFIAQTLGGKGRVIVLQGLSGASVDMERGAGFELALEGTDVEIIEKRRADFDRQKAQAEMEDLLQTYEDIDAVFAHNDEMALGALKAATLAGRQMIIVGFDGADDAIIAVQDGSLDATVAQQPEEIGRVGVQAVMKYLLQGSVIEEVPVPLKLITNVE